MKDTGTGKLVLCILLNNAAIVFLVLVILSLLLETFKNKNFRSHSSIFIYILETLILCLNPTLMS